MLDQVNLASGWSWPPRHGGLGAGRLAPAAMAAQERRGKGPAGPEDHQGVTGEVGRAGGGPAAMYFDGGEVGTCRETVALEATPALLGSIRLAGRKRAAQRRSTASRQSSGWLLVAAGGDGHGGSCGALRNAHGRERR
jgi:hypothetical protein